MSLTILTTAFYGTIRIKRVKVAHVKLLPTVNILLAQLLIGRRKVFYFSSEGFIIPIF